MNPSTPCLLPARAAETELRLPHPAALFERREAHKEILSWQKNAFRKS